MPTLPTVKIQRGDGFAVINESDFDEDEHTLYGESSDEGGTGERYKVRERSAGWFDVYDTVDEENVNESALREDAATDMVRELNEES